MIRQEAVAALLTIYACHHASTNNNDKCPTTAQGFPQKPPPKPQPTTSDNGVRLLLLATIENDSQAATSSNNGDEFSSLSSARFPATGAWSPELQVYPYYAVEETQLDKHNRITKDHDYQYQYQGDVLLDSLELEPFYAERITFKTVIPPGTNNNNNNNNGAHQIAPTTNGHTMPAKNGKAIGVSTNTNGVQGAYKIPTKVRPPPVVQVDDAAESDFSGELFDDHVMDSLSGFDGILADVVDTPGFDAIPELRSWEGSLTTTEIVNSTITTTTTTTTKTSRFRRVFSFVRNAWGKLSPLQIFASGHEQDATASSSSSSSSSVVQEEEKKEKQKRSKEEAMVARMSRKKKKQLSNLLKSVNRRNTKSMAGITARTLTGLISALAEEAEGLSVRINAREDTPIWRKQIDTVSIEFTRLGFKPLHLGGPDQQLVPKSKDKDEKNGKLDAFAVTEAIRQSVMNTKESLKFPTQQKVQKQEKAAVDDDDEDDSCPVEILNNPIARASCADTAFQQIDVDNSGALDKDEIAEALVLAASGSSPFSQGGGSNNTSSFSSAADVGAYSRKAIKKLAKQLVDLYDTNDDGVIDRMEYQSMVEDMAALRQVQKEREEKEQEEHNGESWWSSVLSSVFRSSDNDDDALIKQLSGQTVVDISNATIGDDLVELAESALSKDDIPETLGKIELENLKIDLRQLVFGAIPVVKHITPGGPLFLEPFKVTVTGSFSAEDIMKSSLLDAGLRQLVSFALRVRVRSLRDLADGAVFHGRKWKRSSAKAPLVECTELTNVEMDDKDRVIITGRAKVRASLDAPVIDQSFKLRTKVATPRNGRAIKLSEPEIAIVIECPQQWEKNINATFAKLNMEPPPKPKPIYTYIPIHSPFKKDDDTGGYYMGEDNQIKSMYIKDKCLRFEMETILRPGKFLGSHYLAFTVPQRALIITVDRVKEGMRAARRRKKALRALRKARAEETDLKAQHAEDALAALNNLRNADLVIKNPAAPFTGNVQQTLEEDDEEEPEESTAKGFISRFVDGYLQANVEDEKVKLAHAISDWFGRQGISDSRDDANPSDNSAAGIESQRPRDAVTNVIEDITFEQIRDDDASRK